MKRLWLILLTLCLAAVFSVSAMAVDVKVSGEFYAAGLYQDKTTFMKNTANEGPSTAFYFQRLRVRTDLVIVPGLSLVARFDAMERSWGATRSTPGSTLMIDSAGTRAENENIAFDWAYISYLSPIGMFVVGYAQYGMWGTEFSNSEIPTGQINWSKMWSGISTYTWIKVTKRKDNSYSAINSTTYSDRDNDEYMGGITRYGKNYEVGLLFDFLRYADGRNGVVAYPLDYGYVSTGYLLSPYTKLKLGPVSVEAELNYAWGNYLKFDGLHTGYQDMSLSNLQAYLKAVADFGPVYVGGIFAYVAGDDPGTTDRVEGGYLTGGREFKPALMLFNTERSDWAGSIPGYNAGANALGMTYGSVNGPMSNAWFFQLRAGVKPISGLDIMAAVSFANADKKPTAAWLYNDYGYEVDLTANYKITNNLSYMLGGGYLFTGKYFKGTGDGNEVRDNFMLINKLTLIF